MDTSHTLLKVDNIMPVALIVLNISLVPNLHLVTLEAQINSSNTAGCEIELMNT